jgi:DNA-binding transcriptional LysR family regulator
MNLANVDLDLFVVLHAVLTERSATRAAARLHITRPAVSNALARLRLVLNDPLVVRSARGLVPTPRAMEIAPIVASALEQISAVVTQTATFDPSTTTRRFTIACSDSEQISILPAVFSEFRRRLPAASLRVAGIDQMLATGGLSSGEVDVMIATMPTAPAGLRMDLLLTDHFVCIARIRHPSLHRKVTSAQFWALPHVDVALLADRPTFGSRLAEMMETKHGRTRRVALTAPNFMCAAMAAARTDWLVTLPASLAAALAKLLPIQILKMPFELPPIPTHLVWHPRADTDAGARLFRKMVIDWARGASKSRGQVPSTHRSRAAAPRLSSRA